jgi:transcriptional regulator with XRE-family HTH domain
MAHHKKTIYSEEYRSIVDKLTQLRIHRGHTQKQVAKLAGVSQSYISKIENYQIRMDIMQLKLFADIYQVYLDDLLS